MCLGWACSREIKHCLSTDICSEICEDISVKMRQRALRGYGIQVGDRVYCAVKLPFCWKSRSVNGEW